LRRLYRIIHPSFIAILLIGIACSIPNQFTPTQEQITYRYDDLPAADEADAALSNFRAVSAWDHLDLTYFFINGTGKIAGEREHEIVRQAFGLWAGQSPLTFTEVFQPSQADILIGWASGEHGDGDPFDGPGDVLAHASYPNPYTARQVFLHFDDDERWVDSPDQNVDLLSVAAHEIGHNLGLDHSRDPDSLMFPSYSGPHRFLAEDDIAGVQSLYGLSSPPVEAPESPPLDVTPPPSDNQDSDEDGISDQDEILRTGTDPEREDTDEDGLGDGVEVIYRMNPLDPDMDKDGVNDGQEVAAGTDPFFPDQSTDISPELEEQVSEFLTSVIELQIMAYREGDATIAASVMAGDIYPILETNIADLNRRGLVQLAEIDYYQSYIDDIEVIAEDRIDVRTCEVWSTATYRRADGELVDSSGPTLLPQTITIERINSDWFVTDVEFFDAPAFCR
jgi:hypothetical protein